MEITKNKKDKIMLAIIGLIILIFVGVYLTYDNKFWFGLAGVLCLPLIFVAFLLDVYGSESQ